MITRLELKNFRCFTDFCLDEIKPITLIAGENGVGKTTLLESVFLFMDRNNGGVFSGLNYNRGIPYASPSPEIQWGHFFSQMNVEQPINITIYNDEKPESIELKKFIASSWSSFADFVIDPSMLVPLANSYPLKMDYISPNRTESYLYFMLENGIQQLRQRGVPLSDTPYIQIISSRTFPDTPSWLTMVENHGSKVKCIEYLQIIDKRIKDISLGFSNGMNEIYVDVGLPMRLPIKMLGDGINKLLNIILTLLAHPGSILLLDEMENGFHYSRLPDVWKTIARLTNETKCQIFATTHSRECLEGAYAFSKGDNELFQELFQFVRLERDDSNKIIPFTLDSDDFTFALEQNWEVR